MKIYIYEILLAYEFWKHSNASYFNECLYTTKAGVWQKRFWDDDTYTRLVSVKSTVDPETRFACRHCVGNIDGDNLGN